MRDRASLTTSPFLLGAFAPVMREISAYVLPVAGTLPAELDGLFTQIGPNPIKPPKHTDVDRYQWFAQDGMVSGVRIRHGRAEWFRNRWVRSSRVTRALAVASEPSRRPHLCERATAGCLNATTCPVRRSSTGLGQLVAGTRREADAAPPR